MISKLNKKNQTFTFSFVLFSFKFCFEFLNFWQHKYLYSKFELRFYYGQFHKNKKNKKKGDKS